MNINDSLEVCLIASSLYQQQILAALVFVVFIHNYLVPYPLSLYSKNTNEMYKDLTPNLMVSDIDKTIEFYSDVLNFNVLQTVPNDGKNVFAILQAGNIMLMFQEEENLKQEYPQLKDSSNKAGLTLYIHVSDIHELHNTIKDKAKIIKDLYTTFYGSTDFAIEDCNGYILTFSQAK